MFSSSWFIKQHGIHDVKVTDNTRAIRCIWYSNLYLRIILFINYLMEEILFVNVVSCKDYFITQKNTKREWHLDRLISRVQVLSVFYPKAAFTTLRWLCITLINLLNVVSTNSFSWASNVTSFTTWCTKELRRLELIQYKRAEMARTCLINNSNQSPFIFPPSCQE